MTGLQTPAAVAEQPGTAVQGEDLNSAAAIMDWLAQARQNMASVFGNGPSDAQQVCSSGGSEEPQQTAEPVPEQLETVAAAAPPQDPLSASASAASATSSRQKRPSTSSSGHELGSTVGRPATSGSQAAADPFGATAMSYAEDFEDDDDAYEDDLEEDDDDDHGTDVGDASYSGS
jgi:hypothetical protein